MARHAEIQLVCSEGLLMTAVMTSGSNATSLKYTRSAVLASVVSAGGTEHIRWLLMTPDECRAFHTQATKHKSGICSKLCAFCFPRRSGLHLCCNLHCF